MVKQQASGILSMKGWFVALAVIWVLHAWVMDHLGAYYFSILMYAGINIILATSLNLVSGVAGQFSMGHAGFMSVGGYVSAVITIYLRGRFAGLMDSAAGQSVAMIPALLSGGVIAAVAGYLVGLPSLRLKGDYLAIVTLGFGEIIRVIILNMDSIGGARGLSDIPPLSNFFWVYASVLVTLFCIWRFIQSAHGRSCISVREDEIAAEAMGVHTTQAKVRAFVIGAFFAGVAGGLFAHNLSYLNPSTFDFNRSFEIIIMVVLGGLGSITGSVVAAVFLTIIKEALRPLQEITKVDLRMVIYSLMLIILMLTRPNGLFGRRELPQFFRRIGSDRPRRPVA